MSLIRQWKYWSWFLLLFGTLADQATADARIIMTRDPDYYNPFATSIKYNITFNDADKDRVWDVIYTIMDNRTGKASATHTFRRATFNGTGGFYFYIQNQVDCYEFQVCLLARNNYTSETTMMSRQLKGHQLQIVPEVVLEPEKEQLLFTMKPCLREWMAVSKEGYDDIYFGYYSGTSEVDWSFLIEFRENTEASEENRKKLAENAPKKEPIVFQTIEELEKYVKEIDEKYRRGLVSIDELNQAQSMLNKLIDEKRKKGLAGE